MTRAVQADVQKQPNQVSGDGIELREDAPHARAVSSARLYLDSSSAHRRCRRAAQLCSSIPGYRRWDHYSKRLHLQPCHLHLLNLVRRLGNCVLRNARRSSTRHHLLQRFPLLLVFLQLLGAAGTASPTESFYGLVSCDLPSPCQPCGERICRRLQLARRDRLGRVVFGRHTRRLGCRCLGGDGARVGGPRLSA